ncbi:hypothetical protein K1719_018342 [Acacia pycnantha]|nr:hypothetical protein K1719_018342 [Acacia pycnantha]
MQVLEYQTPPFTDSSLVDECRFVHSSNGLLCLELIKSKSYILWNPAIREVLQLPKVLDLHLLVLETQMSRAPILRHLVIPSLVGFGFDPIANDYKIVRLFASFLNDNPIHTVEVFSLNSRSWKEVEAGKLEFIFPFELASGCGFTFDGAIFWLGFNLVKKDESSHYLILSFDIGTESFTLIPLPSYVPISPYNRLTIYENKLAMLANTEIEDIKSSSIDLWAMDKCVDASGERWIWTKIYTSSLYPDGLLRPYTIWQNEIFCELEASSALDNDEEELVLCNLHTNEFKMLSIGKYPIRTQILNYEESLISVGNVHIKASSS